MPISVNQALLKARQMAKTGDTQAAAQLYKTILNKLPNNRSAREGLKLLQQPMGGRRPSGSASLQAQINGLMMLLNQGRLPAALKQGTALAKRHPGIFVIHNILGAAHMAMDNPKKALDCYTRVVRLKPDFAEAHNNLGVSLKDIGEFKKAKSSFTKAIALKPGYAEAHNNLGGVRLDLGQTNEAIISLKKAIELNPRHAHAHNNLGIALNQLGQHEEAITSFNTALELIPDYAEALSNLGGSLKDLGRYTQAVSSLTKALLYKPDYGEAHNNLGFIYKDTGRHTEAISSLNRAIQINPEHAEAHNNLGIVYKDLGRIEEAVSSYERAIEIRPEYAEALYNLSKIVKYRPDHPHFRQMQRLLKNPKLKSNDRMCLMFALAKAHDDAGQIPQMFEHLAEGNRIRKTELKYDIDNDRQLFRDIMAVFDSSRQAATPDSPDDTGVITPVFIVGMPRSGTSLVEQILASHSKVFGAGELDALNNILFPIISKSQHTKSEPIDEYDNHAIRQRYLAELSRLNVPEVVITDKMPLNFRWIGFILTAFPNARIIHLNRDPMAICWSNYKQNFTSTGNGYAYDLEDIANYFKLHEEMMSFWWEKFPGEIYQLDYEALTENQEDETHKLLAYCKLDWEEQCLDFHQNSRAVRTASSMQVRKQMYKGSSKAWKKYQDFLQPMIRALEH